MSLRLFYFVFRWASYWAIWLIPQYTGPECTPSQAFGLSHLKLDPYDKVQNVQTIVIIIIFVRMKMITILISKL